MRKRIAGSMPAAILALWTAAAPAQTPAASNAETVAVPAAAQPLKASPPALAEAMPAPLSVPPPRAPTGPVIDAIRAAGHFDCGTVTAADDWNGTDLHGNLSALGGEICRAVAVAILGKADAVEVREFPGEPEALSALRAGTIQLAATISPDTTIAAQYGVGFGPPVFYDTQRFLVSRLSRIERIGDLHDQLICTMDMTQNERTLRDEMTARGIPYALMAHSEQGEMDAAIAVRHCGAGAGMESRLAQSRAQFHALVSDFDFLPDHLSLEPVVPAYRYGDQIFGMIVDWTVYALIEAEALGITRANVADAGRREDLRAERLLGEDFATARCLGLAHDWAAQVVAAVGNYGEIYERTVGKPYHLERGLNQLWTKGGLMRPLPIR
jgi:general L-amino acid transport system substrate-binding protein